MTPSSSQRRGQPRRAPPACAPAPRGSAPPTPRRSSRPAGDARPPVVGADPPGPVDHPGLDHRRAGRDEQLAQPVEAALEVEVLGQAGQDRLDSSARLHDVAEQRAVSGGRRRPDRRPDRPAGCRHADELPRPGPGVLHVVEHEAGDDRVEAVVGEGQVGQAGHRDVGAQPRRGECGHVGVQLHRDRLGAAVAGSLDECTGAAADVEQPPTRRQSGDQRRDAACAQPREAPRVRPSHTCPQRLSHGREVTRSPHPHRAVRAGDR